MMRDVFYYGQKPNVHPKEKPAKNLADARKQATTEHFWIINEFCDYRNFDWDFDFDFLPDQEVWTENHINVWPSIHQKDSGTWLCPKKFSDVVVYRCDVDKVIRKKNISSNWKILENIDITRWDFSWHPDPTDPPYIYKWGCKFFPVELKSCIEYHVEGATNIKYMSDIVELLPNWELIKTYHKIDYSKFDMSWRPSPLDPPMIYVWGNKFVDGKTAPTLEYHVPGATEKKYLPELITLLPHKEKFEHLENSDGIDYTWIPNPASPPYIYAWGNQWNKPEDKVSIQYVVEGATEYKYMDERAVRKPCLDNWIIPDNIDTTGFDFSWEPSPADPPYIYQFGTQWQKTNGPRYVVADATEIKYIDIQKAKALPTTKNWTIPNNLDITGFDFSWHPDETSPPYIYHFATQWALTGGPIYTCEGATEVKYLEEPSAIALPDRTNWEFDPKLIDVDSFDFSWHPYVEDQPYVYVFGTQHQKTGGPRYITPGVLPTSPVKYIDTRIIKATRLANKKKFSILNNYKIKDFDYSWHPDETEEPYIYVFGNNQYSAEIMPTIEYAMPGAKQIKYVNDIVATLDIDMQNWKVPKGIDVSNFDFSWKPNPKDPAYIYQFGTQHQKTGGPRYVVEGATEVKYVTTQYAIAIPTKKNWTIPSYVDVTNFDFSWHPDDTSPPYIYHFATQWALTGGPIYRCKGAKEVKYLESPSAVALPNKENWEIPSDVDIEDFDFSWHPYVEDQPYIYQFGTQHQKTGGPKYITPGVIPTSPVKYIDTRILKAKKLENKKKFSILNNYKIKDFDYSWHPDDTDEPYIYVFGNNQYPAEIMPTIEYVMPGAKQIKYVTDIVATLDVDMTNWVVPKNVDTIGFDFTWKPNPKDPAYIYQFGTQWQKTGGPRYVVEGATEVKYVTTQKVTHLPNKKKFKVLDNLVIDKFDFSWHPDETDGAYIYVFGNNQYPAEIMPTIEYVMPGATQIKYINDIAAELGADKKNWIIPKHVDISNFDFSWKPNPKDPPLIYHFGTQHQKTGGPRYIVEGATQSKYITSISVTALPNKKNFKILDELVIKSFDWSWHPDETDGAYIYVFGNNQYPPEIMPTIEYAVEGASQIKYVHTIQAVLDTDKKNWDIPKNLDVSNFDFSWKPNPTDPAYIYEFGTQWQKTGGPRYVVSGATETKYVTTQKAIALPSRAKWTIPANIDITGFDFSWHPDSTSPPYIYHFATQWALTGGPIYTCEGATEVKYMDHPSAIALPCLDNWNIPKEIDKNSFDFSWHPYVEDQPYVYVFGTQHQKTGGPKYITPGVIPTSPIKYIDTRIIRANRIADKKKFSILNNYKVKDFDYSWHPDDTDEPFIYVFGNNQYSAEIMPTLEYAMPGAKQIKYVTDIVATLDVDMTNWVVPSDVDVTSFDFSWKPNPKDPAYIYQFGTQHQKTGGPRYVVPDATEVKYVTTQQVKALPSTNNWTIPSHVDVTNFDFSWHPDDTSPPYIYHFATQWALTGGPIYTCEGATEVKYLEYPSAVALPNKDNWEIPDDIVVDSFDFSWHPYVEDQPYVYVFGTQHQKTGGPRYITPGVIPTSPVKYIDTRILKAQKISNKKKFGVLNNYKIKDFDYSWHPDETDEPFIYVFGNNQYPAEIMPTIEYAMPGAKQIKYINDIKAVLDVDMTNWQIPEGIDTSEFDFSWKPNPKDPLLIYQFGTQHQKTGGPRYVTPGATVVKYVETIKVKALPDETKFVTLNDYKIKDFDYSWHPDATEEPYIYVFGNNQYPAEIMPTVEYRMEGATTVKYVNDIVATLDVDMNNWVIPSDIEVIDCDYSWKPNPKDPAYIYEFGTQWQKTGGIKYVVNGAAEVKYLDLFKSIKIANKKNFAVLNNYKIKDFDYSWHPDQTEEPFIYVFGNNQYPAEIMPTLEYAMPGAKQVKYISDIVATLDVDMSNWDVPENVDTTGFDFSWKPNPKDPAYIYEFGTQWQKTGGPRYVVPDATEVKYVTTQQVKALPTKENWTIPLHVDVTNFDFSWHPDDTSPPYIYHFATQWALTGGPIYTVAGATEKKYLEDPSAIALPNKDNWEVPLDVDITDFDFSWHPYVEDQPYIYQFGTQHQKTGGPRYITPGVIPTSPIKYIDTRILKAKKLSNKRNFAVLNNYKIKDFDYSWHPDNTDEPFIYVFGNNQYPAEIMPTIEYAMPGAKQIKYINDVVAILDVDMNNWVIPKNVDITTFDFSWKPNPKDPAYIYEFGTQWQKTGGPRYVVEGATETKYVTTQQVKALPSKDNWTIPAHIDVTDFDFSWHPDSTSPPYIYHFATQWALSGGPVYRVKDATEVKYMEEPCARALPNKDNWEIPSDIDSKEFDFSWHPYVEDQPYVYVFGTQHQKTGGPRYITPGVIPTSPIKYIDTRILKAKKLPNRNNFAVLNNYKIKDFDWSWHPDETDEPFIYVFGNNQYPAEIMPTIEYAMPGAKQIKYINSVIATLDDDRTNWVIPEGVDVSEFDFSWKPNPKDPAYIYQFGTQWQKTGGPRYVVEGAEQVKYVDGSKAKSLTNRRNWVLPKDISIVEFDYSWHPDETEAPYIYVFGTQWQLTAGPKYVVEGATEYKYMDVNFAKAGPTEKNWVVPSDIVLKSFDFSWHPHPDDPMFIYQFGTQWHDRGGPRYVSPGANKDTPVKYIDTRISKAILGPNKNNWEVPSNVDTTDFDFSWVPHPDDPPYIYQFGTQWQKTGGPKYTTPGAKDIKYVDTLKAKRLPSKANWFNPYKVDTKKFDYSWHPDDTSPPYIYQFGTILNRDDGPRYITPNSKGEIIYLPTVETEEVLVEVNAVTVSADIVIHKYFIETTLESLVNQHPNEVFWAMNKNIDYTNFDFDWRPESLRDMEYVQVFGSPDSEMTHTYFVSANSYLSGNKSFKFIDNVKLTEQELSKLFIKPDMFFVDRGNKESQSRFEKLKEKHGNVQKTRFLNSWVDTINRCINRSSTELCWILNSELDYTNFDFSYYPNPWQMKMVHVFGTQWNHWGTTFMVNRETFASDTKYIKVIEHLNNLNFVKDRIATANSVVHDIIYIDHGNFDEATVTTIKNEGKLVVKYDNDYLTTFKTILSKLPEKKEHFIWIVSSVCEYDKFDFTYICDPYAREQLHVFPSDRQKFGDTFFVNVNRLRELVNNMQSLKDYDKINYNQALRTSRLPAPLIVNEFDSHVMGVMQEFDFPYATFVTSDNKDIVAMDEEPMSLWDQESKTVLITSTGGTRIVVPKEAKQYVETQLYDYPYIKTASRLAKSNPLDIVYLSNGEKCAEENYEHLVKITKGLPNRLVRVDGVNGRVQAYHAAAEASNTSWFLTVFAKLKVNAKFDFNWQPDRLQIPKHYMFLARNPVNGLIYGHQGLIAYNKQMTLDNDGQGLDFTLDSPHETIELLSGIATFNTDEFSTWRTAFREAIKLKKENSDISLKRLESWLTKAEGDFAQYSLNGAKDGVAYYNKVKGKLDKLRLSYEWDWLSTYFRKKYK